MACLGAFLGFRCMTRARAHTGFARANWLILAAVSIGAAGNWAMHFIAMLGVSITGKQILYNVPMTIESMLVAIVVVGIGLLVWHGSDSGVRVVTGGVIAGIGIAAMHYMGEAAMVMPESVRYNKVLIGASILIALIAGVASVWAGTRVHGAGASIVAALIIGVGVLGVHYVAMEAMEMSPGPMSSMSGSSAGSFLFPLVLGISLVTFILALTITLSPTEDEINADTMLRRRIQDGPRRDARTAGPASPPAFTVGPKPAAPRRPAAAPWAAQQQSAATPPEGAAAHHAAARGRQQVRHGAPSRGGSLRLMSRVPWGNR